MNKLKTFLKTLNSDEQEQFAIRCGTSIKYLRKAMSEGTTFKTQLAINIERESLRAVTVEDLNPDADWAFIRQAA